MRSVKNRKRPFSQNSGSNSNKSNHQLYSPEVQTSNQQIKIQQMAQKRPQPPKNQNMLKNMKVRFLINSLIKKIRHLSPPHQVPDNVRQQWQLSAINQDQQPKQQNKQYSKQTLSQQLIHQSQIYRHINLLQGILIVLFCWTITISIVFQQKIGYQLFLVALIFSFVKIIFISILIVLKQKSQEKQIPFIQVFLDDLMLPTSMTITSAFYMIRYSYDLGWFGYIIQAISLITVVLQYRHIQIHFQNVVKYAEHNRMKKQLRIIELFLLIITLAHIFGLFMYAIHYVSPDGKSWLNKVQIQNKQWLIQYIYCFYWAITTMVTVGYGDITPTNHYQVLIVTCIQLIGTAVFGYMINVIGITVDQIKKKSQQFDNYQQTINKLRDHYQLSRQLCHKMKYDIKQKQNQFKNIPLKTSEQTNFLDYIQPNLKEQFVLQTNMKVIKKSIFFLTHFTVNFQNEVALKLIRIIYKPDQQIEIMDSQTQQRFLTIINNGAANIFIQNNHNNISITKKVRQIKPSDDSLVMNVFGYSSLIVNRNIRLKAVAKQNAVTYVLRRKDILQCMDKSLLDFQSFNELRQKMALYKMLEQVQAPSLKQSQYHFLPNIFLIQKKITYQNQSRLSYERMKKRTKLKLITCKNYGNKTVPKIYDQNQGIMQGGILIYDDQQFHSLKSFPSIKNQNSQAQKDSKNDTSIQKLRIDQCKVFENFMKGSNLPIIAASYQKSCQKKSYRRRFRTSIITKSGNRNQSIIKKK